MEEACKDAAGNYFWLTNKQRKAWASSSVDALAAPDALITCRGSQPRRLRRTPPTALPRRQSHLGRRQQASSVDQPACVRVPHAIRRQQRSSRRPQPAGRSPESKGRRCSWRHAAPGGPAGQQVQHPQESPGQEGVHDAGGHLRGRRHNTAMDGSAGCPGSVSFEAPTYPSSVGY